MLDNLFSGLQEQQEQMRQKLAEISVEAESGDGAITVKATADQQISNITLDPSKLDLSDREQLEDLLLVAVNRALDLAREKAAIETNRLLRDMLPFGGLPGM